MDNFLDSVTRKGRKVKDRLRGKKGKMDKTRANTAESIGSPSSLLQPVSHITAGGHDGEESRVSADTRQVHSRGRSPQPESMTVRGRGNEEGRESVVDEKRASQGHSCPEPNAETVVGGGAGPVGVGPLSPSPSTLTSHGGKPEST